jgi:hypothetical protein
MRLLRAAPAEPQPPLGTLMPRACETLLGAKVPGMRCWPRVPNARTRASATSCASGVTRPRPHGDQDPWKVCDRSSQRVS